MFTAKAIFKAEFVRVRALVRALSNEQLAYADEEYCEFQYPTHYYRYIRKEMNRRFGKAMSIDDLAYAENQSLKDWEKEIDLEEMLMTALAE